MTNSQSGKDIAKEIAKDIPTFLYQKLWDIYLLTNEKRVKSFFYLISTISFLLLIIIDEKEVVKLLGTEINVSTAIIIFSLFIYILSLRYFVLSALAFGNHSKFNGYFEAYKSSFDLSSTVFRSFKFENFKSDDVNEFPNMFLIPLQIDKSNKINMPSWIKKLMEYVITLLFWIFHCSAIFLYAYLFIFNKNYKASIYLIILAGGLIMVIIYFLFGTNKARQSLKGG